MMNYEIAAHHSGARNDSPLLSLRGAEGDEAISVGRGDCHASLAMTKEKITNVAAGP